MLFNNAYFVLYRADADRNKAVIKHPGIVLSSILYWGRSKVICNHRVMHDLNCNGQMFSCPVLYTGGGGKGLCMALGTTPG